MNKACSLNIATMLIVTTLGSTAHKRSKIKHFEGEENKNKVVAGAQLIEGDMLVQIQRRGGLKDTDFRWPRRTIIYDYADHVQTESKRLVLAAMNHVKSKTRGCVKFTKRKRDQNFVLLTTNDTGCYAHVGYWGWHAGFRQKMNIDMSGCRLGQVIHELVHVIGFMHEHSRPDRDDYVDIKWDNILEETKMNFEKRKKSEINSFKNKYDYGSIMHYGTNFFSKNGQDTIVAKDGSRIGQRDGLSESDAKQIRLMYGCK